MIKSIATAIFLTVGTALVGQPVFAVGSNPEGKGVHKF